MTMDSMVKFLEDKGFGVSKRYNSLDKEYKFSIAKDGMVLKKVFIYPSWLLNNSIAKNVYMEQWLDEYIKEFEEKAYLANDIASTKKLVSAQEAKEFRDHLMALAESDERKLFGDISTGYCYFGAGNGKTILEQIGDYVTERYASRYNYTRIKNLNLTENEKGINEMYRAYATCPMTMPTVKRAYGPFEIEKVIFNAPATIVFWKDGTKTVVKAVNEAYDPEKGLAMAIAKKAYGNEGNYFNNLKKYTEPYKKNHDTHSNAWAAQQRLLNAMNDKKATKKDLLLAMEEAVAFMEEYVEG